MTQYRQNKLFRCNKKALNEEVDDIHRETSDTPQAKKFRKFQREIWDEPVQYKKNAEWWVKFGKELEIVKIQNNVVITKEGVIKQVRKMPN